MGHVLALHGILVLGGRLGSLHGLHSLHGLQLHGLHGLQLHGLHGLQLHGIQLHGFHGFMVAPFMVFIWLLLFMAMATAQFGGCLGYWWQSWSPWALKGQG